MSMMITKNPLSRLTKLSHIKAHPWLLNFSWDNLISLDISSSFVSKNIPLSSDLLSSTLFLFVFSKT